ncbi:MAG: helix-turn-helix transcriptional regulator [Verrucomicrobia bacterium]|nr:helix-turn-helix transcriptional regulator [Verrucomicrobiota bacterium]MDA1066144.1 helix-turn-helix transcriptional regulator [Verrucomicrobiota bacterium]
MRFSLIQDTLSLNSPDDYFTGRSAEDICIPRNLIVFSRKTNKDLQRKSFDGYPHHRYVLVFNLMTEGTMNVDGIHWRLKPENALMVFPYQFHHFIDLADRNLVWLFITFELELPTAMQGFRHRILQMDQRCHELLARIINHYRELSGERSNRRLTLDCAMLINHLREQVRDDPTVAMLSGNVKGSSNALIRGIQNCLTSNAGSLQSVSDIASELNMSESNLRAVFRQQFNISLGAYIKNFRAHLAIQLMQNPRMSFTDIAFELGFTTLSSFSRFFANTIGVSPRQYRNNVAKGTGN